MGYSMHALSTGLSRPKGPGAYAVFRPLIPAEWSSRASSDNVAEVKFGTSLWIIRLHGQAGKPSDRRRQNRTSPKGVATVYSVSNTLPWLKLYSAVCVFHR